MIFAGQDKRRWQPGKIFALLIMPDVATYFSFLILAVHLGEGQVILRVAVRHFDRLF